jgi:tetratricopeptide (TPR) repeat protein
MYRIVYGLALVAAACSPADVLSNQGSTLRNTDFVQMGVEEQRKKDAEKAAKEQAAAAHQAEIDRFARSAQAHVDLFEYPAAVSDWKDAYRLASDPVYLLRIAESQRAMGNCGEAQLMYQQYLDKAVASAPDVGTARAHLEEAKKCETRLGSNADAVHKLYKSGSTHYELSEYEAAIKDFKEAYRLSEDPSYLFNIGQSYRLMRSCGEAMRYYERYLGVAGDIPNKDKVQGRIEEMRACAK